LSYIHKGDIRPCFRMTRAQLRALGPPDAPPDLYLADRVEAFAAAEGLDRDAWRRELERRRAAEEERRRWAEEDARLSQTVQVRVAVPPEMAGDARLSWVALRGQCLDALDDVVRSATDYEEFVERHPGHGNVLFKKAAKAVLAQTIPFRGRGSPEKVACPYCRKTPWGDGPCGHVTVCCDFRRERCTAEWDDISCEQGVCAGAAEYARGFFSAYSLGELALDLAAAPVPVPYAGFRSRAGYRLVGVLFSREPSELLHEANRRRDRPATPLPCSKRGSPTFTKSVIKEAEKYFYKTTIANTYGMTPKMIAELGDPDKLVENPHYKSGPPAGLYKVKRVEAWLAGRD
jgi:hypothetical protein